MVHVNSFLSYREIKPSIPDRKHIIFRIFQVYDRPLTDREVLIYIYGQDERDANLVRPRITELIDDGTLKECGTVNDLRTGRPVRLVRVVRPEENKQPELF